MGATLRVERLKHGLSIRDVGDALGKNPSWLFRVETGEITVTEKVHQGVLLTISQLTRYNKNFKNGKKELEAELREFAFGLKAKKPLKNSAEIVSDCRRALEEIRLLRAFGVLAGDGERLEAVLGEALLLIDGIERKLGGCACGGRKES